MVLVSLIIGLGVAELLTGVAQTIRNRDTVRQYWVHTVFVVIVFLALLQQWWEIWGVRDTPVWTFPGLLMMLGGPVGLFLISHLLYPEPISGSDYKSYYYNKMGPVRWVGVITVVVAVTFRPVVLGNELFTADNLSSVLLVAIFIGMNFTRKEWFHGATVILVLMGLMADIMIFNVEIR